MHPIKVFLSLLILYALYPQISIGKTWDIANIESFVVSQLEKNIQAPINGKISFIVSKLDPRVRIKPCQSPIKANIPENTNRRNVNIKVSCNDKTPWHIYLPAKIERTFAVVVSSSVIEKGEILTHDNIKVDYIAKNRIRGERLTEISALLGSKAKKRIGEDNAITTKSICLICKGDAITIIAKSKNFMIKTKGTALSSGNLNDQIKVKNARSGRIIKPKITAINQVTIHL